MKQSIAALVLCIVAAAASATAQEPSAPPASGMNGARMARMISQLQGRFAAANTTHDGKLTREQAQAGMPMVAQHFDDIDTQHAGFVTLAQIEDFMRARAASR